MDFRRFSKYFTLTNFLTAASAAEFALKMAGIVCALTCAGLVAGLAIRSDHLTKSQMVVGDDPETGKPYPQGYTPDPEGTKRFLRSLPKPMIRDAGPDLFRHGDDNRPVLLYRALYAAHKDKFGTDWTVGKQGIGDCFPSGTTVEIFANGKKSLKKIEEITVGEFVCTHYDRPRKVTNTLRKISGKDFVRLQTKNGWTVTATADHQFLQVGTRTEGEFWKSANILQLGDKVKIRDFNTRKLVADEIVSIWHQRKTEELVYCLEVDEDHSFIAEGYVVHNCVSWGWVHGVDIHAAILWKLGLSERWEPSATEAVYGGSRVEANGGRHAGYGDGSYGAAAAKFVTDFGVVFRRPYDTVDLTKYSAARAKEWGNFGCGGRDDKGYLDNICREHSIKSVALVGSFADAAAAIKAGYPVPVCSNQGFSSRRDKDGFSAASGSWAHCMCFVGVRFDRPGLLCLNSWGPDWIKGPRWPEDQPEGSFWVDQATADRMLRGRDSFAVSGFVGFPFRELKHSEWATSDAPSVEKRHEHTITQPLFSKAL